MKTGIIISFLSLFFLFSACDAGLDENFQDVKINEEPLENSLTTPGSLTSPIEHESTRQLRITLTVLSEVLGEHAANSTLVRGELNTLIRSNGSTINLSLFEDRNVLEEIIRETNTRTAEHGEGVPLEIEGVPGLVDPNDIPPVILSDKPSEYPDIVHLDCIEIYLPNGFLTNIYNGITTVAHPINKRRSNKGITYLKISNRKLLMTDVLVDYTFIENNDNVIIVRPNSSGSCNFEDYTNLDYTLFPSN